MADTLTVRLYNVRFGDAILVTVPDRDPTSGQTTMRRILIDVGNAPTVASPEGGDDAVFRPVVDHILQELDGKPLDLYVMTHEHLDHVQGLPHAAWKLHPTDFAQRFRVDHVWLTASAAPDYYDTHPEAKKQKLAFEAMYHRLRAFLAAHRLEGQDRLSALLANNDPTKTSQCVEFLRQLQPARTHYVFRGLPLAGTHGFREAKLDVWAPEEDTGDYYGRFQPFDFGEGGLPSDGAPRPAGPVEAQGPPAGVDVGAFLNLVERRRRGIGDNLLTIDRAANNTSIVFTLEWRGWRLLFAGDAEVRSWRTMEREGVLKPVHFLKVAHHGSHNGTPEGGIFDAILPSSAPGGKKRFAAISTWRDTYGGIPHRETDDRIKSRATLTTTLDKEDDLFFEIPFVG